MAFTHVFVIGDSLVDAGTALGLAEWYDGLPLQDLPEGAPTEAAGYYLGRFSNGYTFADLVSNKAIGDVTEPVFPYHFEDPWLGIPIDPFEGDPSGNNANYAYGGSHIRNGDEVVPDLDLQTDALRDAVDGNIPSSALIIVTMGGNDVRDLAPTGSDPVSQVAAYAELRECAIQLQHELGQLIGDGARNICITGIADVGLIPRYDRDDDSIVAVHQAGALNGVQATARIPLGERLSGWVAATGQMAINSDARLDFDEAARDQSPLRCAVSVPVASSDRSTGVLTFYASEVNAFDDSHRGIAAAAAAAIAPTMAEIAARGVRYGSSPSQNRTHAVRT